MATIGSVNSQQLEFLDDAKVITVTGDNINLGKKPNEWGGYSVAYGNQLAYDFSDGGCYLLDVNKMTDAELDRIFSMAEKDENYPTLIYANIGRSMVCISTVNE